MIRMYLIKLKPSPQTILLNYCHIQNLLSKPNTCHVIVFSELFKDLEVTQKDVTV